MGVAKTGTISQLPTNSGAVYPNQPWIDSLQNKTGKLNAKLTQNR
jgi:hypothetical protein